MSDNLNLTPKLEEILKGMNYTQNKIGCSQANVYHFKSGRESLFLKVEKSNDWIRNEYKITSWLKGRLPVPAIRHFEEKDGFCYLLTEEVPGYMTCDDDKVQEPNENTVKLLAEGILMLQAIDISDCPFKNTLDIKLKDALYNIENNFVDMEDFEESNDFDTPMDLYKYLIQNKPEVEELCFAHGDYCLPNIFIDGTKVTGFIDLGNAGIADKWQDIALCVRSLGYNLRNNKDADKYKDLLFQNLKITPDWNKINYYILLDELF